MTMETEQAELLARVAHLYFEKGDDQSSIARKLRVSRSSVSRLLSQARRRGIVEIRINHPLPLAPELATRLCQRFNLKEALVLRSFRTEGYDARLQVARLAARFLEQHIHDGDTIALSRGSTLHAVVDSVRPEHRRGVRVVQLVGSLRTPPTELDDENLARRLATKFDGDYYNLTAPLFVENVETRLALLQEPAIRQVLDLGRHSSLALVGVGALDKSTSSITRRRLLGASQLETLRKGKAVGEICSQYFDEDGALVSSELAARTIALELDALRPIPRVVGVAVGRHKVKAIRGALRGGYINVIITDDLTAALVLDADESLTSLRPSPAGAAR